MYLWAKRDGAAAERFLRRLLRTMASPYRQLIPEAIHDTSQYANNRAEVSHQHIRVRERGMRRFKSTRQVRRFLGVHSTVYNLFNLGRHLVSAEHHRNLSRDAFARWTEAVA